jgi:site-specific DNA recombinase
VNNRRKRMTYSPTAERRAVLYARFSSDMQRDSWSIDAQVGDLRAYCERMGWAVLEEVCSDEAISGKLDTDERPGLERAMSLIRDGSANVLVVHKIDRFFRSIEKTFRYVNELEGYGAGVVCTQQPIDTTNPVGGKIILAVMAALAESYIDNLSEETSKGKLARANAGLPNGGLPYGYVNPEPGESGQTNHVAAVIVPDRAEAVRLAFKTYATGQSSDVRIARMLNERGYRIVSKWQPAGGPFAKDTITALLQNPFYAGWVAQPVGDGGTNRSPDAPLIRGQHEPIIDQDLYNTVQALRASKRGCGRRGSPTLQTYTYVGAGVVFCSACRQRMRAQGQSHRRPSFRCTSLDRGLDCTCKRKSIPAPIVETSIADAVAGLTMAPDWQQHFVTTMGIYVQAKDQQADKRNALERKRERLQRLLIDGDLDQETYRRERSAIDAEIMRLAPTPTTTVDIERVAALVTDSRALYATATPEERRELATVLFDGVYVDTDQQQIVGVQLKKALQPIWSALPKAYCTQCGSDGHRSLCYPTGVTSRHLSGARSRGEQSASGWAVMVNAPRSLSRHSGKLPSVSSYKSNDSVRSAWTWTSSICHV